MNLACEQYVSNIGMVQITVKRWPLAFGNFLKALSAGRSSTKDKKFEFITKQMIL